MQLLFFEEIDLFIVTVLLVTVTGKK